jgi:hypothetical protein
MRHPKDENRFWDFSPNQTKQPTSESAANSAGDHANSNGVHTSNLEASAFESLRVPKSRLGSRTAFVASTRRTRGRSRGGAARWLKTRFSNRALLGKPSEAPWRVERSTSGGIMKRAVYCGKTVQEPMAGCDEEVLSLGLEDMYSQWGFSTRDLASSNSHGPFLMITPPPKG